MSPNELDFGSGKGRKEGKHSLFCFLRGDWYKIVRVGNDKNSSIVSIPKSKLPSGLTRITGYP